MVDLRHEESVFICVLHWLGTSTRNDSKQFCWTVRRKEHQFQTISLLARHVQHSNQLHLIHGGLAHQEHRFRRPLLIAGLSHHLTGSNRSQTH